MAQESEKPPNEALHQLYMQLEDLVRLTLDAEKKEFIGDNKTFIEVYQKLQQMNRVANAMMEGYQKALESLSLTEEDVQRFRETLKGKEKKMTDTMGRLIQECEAAKERTYKAIQEDNVMARSVKEDLKTEEQKGKKRRDRFKSVGGKKGWMKS